MRLLKTTVVSAAVISSFTAMARAQDITVSYVRGVNDCFALPQESTAPSAALATYAASINPNPRTDYDANVANRYFIETFDNLPAGIKSATLTIHVRPATNASNDTFNLWFTDATGTTRQGSVWGNYYGDGNGNIDSIIRHATPPITNGLPWTATNFPNPCGYTITLDLAALPNPDGTTRNLLFELCYNRYLDVFSQDDTSIDWMQLDVVIPCPADFDGDGFVTGTDFDLFVMAFEAGC